VGHGEVKNGGCDEVVFAVNHCSDGWGGFVLVRGCTGAMGGFVGGGILRCDVVPHGVLGCDKSGVMGFLLESVQLQIVPYGCLPGCARPSLHIGAEI
jgi:hypothetical protein